MAGRTHVGVVDHDEDATGHHYQAAEKEHLNAAVEFANQGLGDIAGEVPHDEQERAGCGEGEPVRNAEVAQRDSHPEEDERHAHEEEKGRVGIEAPVGQRDTGDAKRDAAGRTPGDAHAPGLEKRNHEAQWPDEQCGHAQRPRYRSGTPIPGETDEQERDEIPRQDQEPPNQRDGEPGDPWPAGRPLGVGQRRGGGNVRTRARGRTMG